MVPILILLCANSPQPPATNEAAPARPLAQVLTEAQRTGKPVLLQLGTDWCEACKLLDKELRRPENRELLQAFVFQAYNAEQGNGVEVAAKFEVKSFPTLIALDSKGKELARMRGLEQERLGPWLNALAHGRPVPAALRPKIDPVVFEKKMAVQMAYMKRAPDMGKQCAARAGGLEQALVRIRVGRSGVERIEVLEPGASAGLKSCIEPLVRAVALPPDHLDDRVILEIPFSLPEKSLSD